MLALPEHRTLGPYFIEEGATAFLVKARIKNKKHELVTVTICSLQKKGREDARANAEFIVRACNSFKEAAEVCGFLWNARVLLDDSDAHGGVIQTEEFQHFIEVAGEVAVPGVALGNHGPRMPRVEERKAGTVYQPEPVEAVIPTRENIEDISEKLDSPVTKRKIDEWEKL